MELLHLSGVFMLQEHPDFIIVFEIKEKIR